MFAKLKPNNRCAWNASLMKAVYGFEQRENLNKVKITADQSIDKILTNGKSRLCVNIITTSS
jgi:hypothetical protein